MATVYEHRVNGSVAEYIVRNEQGLNLRIFNASDEGKRAAHDLADRLNAEARADDLARRGWAQPNIRQHLIHAYNMVWIRADVIATKATHRDNEQRGRSTGGHVA